MNKQALNVLFKELEFKNLASRILIWTYLNRSANHAHPQVRVLYLVSAEPDTESSGGANLQTIETVDHEYILVHDLEGIRELSASCPV